MVQGMEVGARYMYEGWSGWAMRMGVREGAMRVGVGELCGWAMRVGVGGWAMRVGVSGL